MNQTIHNLLTEQLASWETARNNYAALSGVQVKELNVNGILYKVQFNPARIQFHCFHIQYILLITQDKDNAFSPQQKTQRHKVFILCISVPFI